MGCRTCKDGEPVKRGDIRRHLQSLTTSVSKLSAQTKNSSDMSVLPHVYALMSQLAEIAQRIEEKNAGKAS